MIEDLSYFSLFISSFLAATILPVSSELHLALMLQSDYSRALMLFCASLGNCMGGSLTFYCARLGKTHWVHKYLGISMEKLVRIQSFVAQYGVWSALLCWLPFIGEPIALALGYFKADSLKFHLLMSLGKTARYIVIIYFLS